jgi:hypothetical protein
MFNAANLSIFQLMQKKYPCFYYFYLYNAL